MSLLTAALGGAGIAKSLDVRAQIGHESRLVMQRDELGRERLGGFGHRVRFGQQNSVPDAMRHPEFIHDLRLVLLFRNGARRAVETFQLEEERVAQDFLGSGAATRRAGAALLGLGILRDPHDS